jgi:hypothetical protein
VVIERSQEAEAFMTTLEGTPPDAVSACAGWTTREVAAHVLGIAIGVIRHMAVAKFIPHLRNEHALHRWDLAGDDDIGGSLLGAMDPMKHSVGGGEYCWSQVGNTIRTRTWTSTSR